MTLNRQYGYDPENVSHGEHFIRFASTVENFKNVFLDVFKLRLQREDMSQRVADRNTFGMGRAYWMKAMGFTGAEIDMISDYTVRNSGGVSGTQVCTISHIHHLCVNSGSQTHPYTTCA